jgi:predicted nucleic acid-binding Zn ribbon protein
MRHAGRNHRIWLPQAERHLTCIACRRPIAYGERCESCKHELRKRQRRKPR